MVLTKAHDIQANVLQMLGIVLRQTGFTVHCLLAPERFIYARCVLSTLQMKNAVVE